MFTEKQWRHALVFCATDSVGLRKVRFKPVAVTVTELTRAGHANNVRLHVLGLGAGDMKSVKAKL